MDPVVNIGLVGHVDHGKTTLTYNLSGKWADTHSEERKRGITIRLGYADAVIRKCSKCGTYSLKEKCEKCKSKTEVSRKVALVDAPGHETLMTVMISASSIMNGAILVIAANEKCPQPQTYEHLMALGIAGVKNIVIVQNKSDLVSKEEAEENYKEIKEFVKGTVAENAPIIPISAHHAININALLQAIEENIPTPELDESAAPMMVVARSFDVNKPGKELSKILGGIIGGSIIQGKFKVKDKISIRPGVSVKGGEYIELETEITELNSGDEKLKEARPGGLIGVATKLDPAITKSDRLVGSIVGKKEALPPVLKTIQVDYKLMERVVGADKVAGVKMGEPLVVSAGTMTTLGVVTKQKPLELKLKRPICAEKGWTIALSRQIGNRWRLFGYGKIK